MLIAIDSNVFIAALSPNEEHSPNAQKLVRDVATGKHTAVASSIVFGEVLGVANTSRAEEIEDFFSHINNLKTHPANDSICVRAGALRREHGPALKLPDAIHLTTALVNSVDVFITNDDRLVKAAQKLIPTKLLSEY
jgi:predicted nucleic acid-binding protein